MAKRTNRRKDRLSKRKVSRRRYSKRRVSRKKNPKRRVSKRRYTKRMKGGMDTAATADPNQDIRQQLLDLGLPSEEVEMMIKEGYVATSTTAPPEALPPEALPPEPAEQPPPPPSYSEEDPNILKLVEMGFPRERVVSALTANNQDINMAFLSLISPDFESESLPNTTQGQAPELEPEPAGAADEGKINVIQFCHLKKHCSKETCIDYLDMESIMKTGIETYKSERRGTPGKDPPMITSLWSPWKSEKGTIELIKKLYPSWQMDGKSDFNVYQVDDPNETLEQNPPPQGEKIDYIFFIYCPFSGHDPGTAQELADNILLYAKEYATSQTKCFATYSGEENNYLSSSKLVQKAEIVRDIKNSDGTPAGEFIKFQLI
tara:strand:+ start:1254 stop:2378 length:1125 start_codon:yes stop_codon:yes gene_type:complete